MEATLKMQCEASGAAYAMYWKDTRGVAVLTLTLTLTLTRTLTLPLTLTLALTRW